MCIEQGKTCILSYYHERNLEKRTSDIFQLTLSVRGALCSSKDEDTAKPPCDFLLCEPVHANQEIQLPLCWIFAENEKILETHFFHPKLIVVIVTHFFLLNCPEVLNLLLMTCMHHYGYSDSSCCHIKSMFSVS